MSEYPSFPKIGRFENLYCIITEKVDGTNGLIEIDVSTCVEECAKPPEINDSPIKYGSRNRYISTKDDNAGFANYFTDYENRIKQGLNDFYDDDSSEFIITMPNILRVYGEWFGKGIHRGYGLDHKQFMPFDMTCADILINWCHIPNIVPTYCLYKGAFSFKAIEDAMNQLKDEGSKVVPGYRQPEGVVIWFPNQNFRIKETFDEAKWKGAMPKLEHDKPPKQEGPLCFICGKRMYANKLTDTWECRNYHCEEGKQNLERLKASNGLNR